MKKLLFVILILLNCKLFAQDLAYAKAIINKLCSPALEGRGYVNSGNKKTAQYLQKEFARLKLGAFDTVINDNGSFAQVYNQNFNADVVTFPKDLIVKFDKDDELIPGQDFFVSPNSGGTILKSFELVYLSKNDVKNEKGFKYFNRLDFSEKCIVINKDEILKYKENEFYNKVVNNKIEAGAIIFLESEKLKWYVGTDPKKYPILYCLETKFPKNAKLVKLKIDRTVLPRNESQNVIGFIKGKKYPNHFIVIASHYDYLGKMGSNLRFSGANDNASGVSMMLNLAKHFSKSENKPNISIAFMAFGGANIGNKGAKYYTENPYFPLSRIRVIINLHKMGTGEKGLTVYHNNGVEYSKLIKVNNTNNYFNEIGSESIPRNSDLYFFKKRMIKSISLSLNGEYPYSFDLNDTPDKLTLSGYIKTFRLLVSLVRDY